MTENKEKKILQRSFENIAIIDSSFRFVKTVLKAIISFLFFTSIFFLISTAFNGKLHGGMSSSFQFQEDDDFNFKKPQIDNDEILPLENFLDNPVFCNGSKKNLKRNLFHNKIIARFKKSNVESHIQNMLFYGPPGTGKTHTASLIAENFSSSYVIVSGGSFERLYVGSGAKRLDQLIAKARKIESENKLLGHSKPVFIIVDEIDSLSPQKSSSSLRTDYTLTNTFLTQIEKIAKDKVNIVVIGTTNVPEQMEEASIRDGRFSCKVNFTLPEGEKELLRLCLLVIDHLKNKEDLRLIIFNEEEGEEPLSSNSVYISKNFLDALVTEISKRRIENLSTFPSILNLINNFIYDKIEETEEDNDVNNVVIGLKDFKVENLEVREENNFKGNFKGLEDVFKFKGY